MGLGFRVIRDNQDFIRVRNILFNHYYRVGVLLMDFVLVSTQVSFPRCSTFQVKVYPRDPSLPIIPTLGLKVCKYHLHWAIGI